MAVGVFHNLQDQLGGKQGNSIRN